MYPPPAAGDLHPGVARYLGFSFLGATELVVLTEFFSEGSLRRYVRSLVEMAWRAAKPPSMHFVRPAPPASGGAAAALAAAAGHNAAAESIVVQIRTIRAYARQVSMNDIFFSFFFSDIFFLMCC